MKKSSYWRNAEYWICPNHLPSIRIPAVCATCWYSSCNAERPPMLQFVEAEKDRLALQVERCAWRDCNKDNGKPAGRREKSKYCSLDCKNRNARWRYKLKKKGLLIPAA